MTPILYLAHRIPYPPNKGDKITTFNLLKFLSARYRVYLGCFIDDPHDRQYIEKLNEFCAGVYCEDICDRSQLRSGLASLLQGQAVSLAHYRSKEFQGWVDRTVAEQQIEKLFVYSSGMAQFVDGERYSGKKRILDMADIDSDKWRQYADNKPFYSSWIYQREYRLLAAYEQRLCRDFDGVTLITDDEAAAFRALVPSTLEGKVHTLGNGVDTEYFSPLAQMEGPLEPMLDGPKICFTGAMDYWANEDAVVWFVEQVWPALRAAVPNALFYIVGGNPTEKVKSLSRTEGVIVTGRVPDVRPYLQAAALAVAPLRIARGVQNKVLEAMAFGKPVVMTSMAQEGIELPESQRALVLDDAGQTAKLIAEMLLAEQHGSIGSDNRDWIVARYGWAGALSTLDDIL